MGQFHGKYTAGYIQLRLFLAVLVVCRQNIMRNTYYDVQRANYNTLPMEAHRMKQEPLQDWLICNSSLLNLIQL